MQQLVDARAAAEPLTVIGEAAFGQVGGNGPVLGVDALDDAGTAQRLQTADMAADIGVGVVGPQPRQRLLAVRCRAVDALRVGCRQDVAISRTGRARRRFHRDDAAAPDVLGAGRWNLDMMQPPVDAVDGEADPLAQFVAPQPFGDHAPDDPLGGHGHVNAVAGSRSVLREPLALQRLMHGLDDVAAHAKLAEHRLGAGR